MKKERVPMKDINDYIVYEEIVEDHTGDGLRAGEGCVTVLPDNSLYFIYGSFFGAADHDNADLVEQRSVDGGLTWTDKKVFLKTPENVLNNMSASTLLLQDGRVAMIYLHKISNHSCMPMFSTSGDNAKTWSEPVNIDTRGGYYVVNNDRLVQLKNGRILLPYAWHGAKPDFAQEGALAYCGCFISDDAGESWRRSKEEKIAKSENIILPKFVDETNIGITKHIEDGWVQCQEPGVVELSNGGVMLWCRTPGGYAYRCYSEDGGETYSALKPIEEFAMPCGPQSIKTLPGTDRLIMLFNDRGEIPYGTPEFHWRTPLSIAVSDDDGVSWRKIGQLEPDEVPSNCYYSICFHDENVIFTYYEGVMTTDDKGVSRPTNLVSLKLKIVKQEYFKG